MSLLQEVTLGDLPQWLQVTGIVGLVMVVLCVLCIVARLKWLFQTIWCLLCCCCTLRPEYDQLDQDSI
jgi:hypothetical protein